MKPPHVRAAEKAVRAYKDELRRKARAERVKAPKASRGRARDTAYLQWVRQQPCMISGPECRGGIEAAHVRFSDARVGRVNPGLQVKPDDRWTLPLCRAHHREGPQAQHAANERQWWEAHGIDASAACLELHSRYLSEGGKG